MERHRLLWLHLTRQLPDHLRGSVLHVAPEPALRDPLRRLPAVSYRSVDLQSPLADDHADLTSLPYPSGSFDLIVCNHVLEHVEDDRAALNELRRVLEPTGVALLQVPIDQALAMTDEEPISSPRERERRYGNRDHVRMYGRDYVERLERCGFRVEVDRFAWRLGDDEIQRFGLGRLEDIHIARHR